MVLFLSLISKQNKRIAPWLLKHGLTARFGIIRKTSIPAPIPDPLLKHQEQEEKGMQSKTGIKHDGLIYDNVESNILDSFCFIPFSQRLISIELHDDMISIEKDKVKKKTTMLDKLADQFWEKMFGKDDESHENENDIPSLLQSFENYVLPALFPNGIWKDRHRWQYNHRFVMWLRKEFFIAKYGQELREILSRNPTLKYSYYHKDSKQLPHQKHIINSFGLQSWTRERNDTSIQHHMVQLTKKLGGYMSNVHHSLQIPVLSDNTDTSHLALEELMELAGANVSNCGSFNLYCEQGNIFELWTKEYIDGLATYILDRTAIAANNTGKETLVLEVGAGDGVLSKHLMDRFDLLGKQRQLTQKLMQSMSDKKNKSNLGKKKSMKTSISSFSNTCNRVSLIPQVISTDDGSWNIKTKTNDVQNFDVKQALEKFVQNQSDERHIIVLCSWMMKGIDWTADFRAAGADEYILIGEKDDGCCGHNWDTWGNPDFMDLDRDGDSDISVGIPPYEADGFERIDLIELSKLQFSRYDSKICRSSSTVSFRAKRDGQTNANFD